MKEVVRTIKSTHLILNCDCKRQITKLPPKGGHKGKQGHVPKEMVEETMGDSESAMEGEGQAEERTARLAFAESESAWRPHSPNSAPAGRTSACHCRLEWLPVLVFPRRLDLSHLLNRQQQCPLPLDARQKQEGQGSCAAIRTTFPPSMSVLRSILPMAHSAFVLPPRSLPRQLTLTLLDA